MQAAEHEENGDRFMEGVGRRSVHKALPPDPHIFHDDDYHDSYGGHWHDGTGHRSMAGQASRSRPRHVNRKVGNTGVNSRFSVTTHNDVRDEINDRGHRTSLQHRQQRELPLQRGSEDKRQSRGGLFEQETSTYTHFSPTPARTTKRAPMPSASHVDEVPRAATAVEARTAGRRTASNVSDLLRARKSTTTGWNFSRCERARGRNVDTGPRGSENVVVDAAEASRMLDDLLENQRDLELFLNEEFAKRENVRQGDGGEVGGIGTYGVDSGRWQSDGRQQALSA